MEKQHVQIYTVRMHGSAMQLLEVIFVKQPDNIHEFWKKVVALWEVD